MLSAQMIIICICKVTDQKTNMLVICLKVYDRAYNGMIFSSALPVLQANCICRFVVQLSLPTSKWLTMCLKVSRKWSIQHWCIWLAGIWSQPGQVQILRDTIFSFICSPFAYYTSSWNQRLQGLWANIRPSLHLGMIPIDSTLDLIWGNKFHVLISAPK